jgi:hypothetical protein
MRCRGFAAGGDRRPVSAGARAAQAEVSRHLQQVALGIVSVRQDSPDAADLAVSLAALEDWTFLLGPGFIVGLSDPLAIRQGCEFG